MLSIYKGNFKFMKKLFYLCICGMLLPAAADAQFQKLPSVVARGMLGKSVQTSVRGAVLSAVRANVPSALASGAAMKAVSQNAYLKQRYDFGLDDMDNMLRDYFVLNPKAASPQMLHHNRQLQEQMVARWLQMDNMASQLGAKLQKDVFMKAKQGRIDYVNYLSPEIRLVMFGEVHENEWMVGQVEQAVYQYVRAYPERNVYYVSEFIDAVPGEGSVYALTSEQEVDLLVRKRPFYRDVTRRFLRAGVRVVGLENPELSEELVKTGYTSNFVNTELAWKTVSPAGMKERNEYWSRIVRRIYEHDPAAVVFVHAGLGHTNYNHPNSLSVLLGDFEPFVVELSTYNNLELNSLIERHFPLSGEVYSSGRELQRRTPSKRLQYIRFMNNKTTAHVAGCDLHVRLARPIE